MKSKLILIILIGLLVTISYLNINKQKRNTNLADIVTSELVERSDLTQDYIIDKQLFRVPVGYHFSHSLFRGVPTASTAKNVEAFSISALLPDLEPITENNQHEFTGRGYGRKILILVMKNNGVKPISRYFSYLESSGSLKKGESGKVITGLSSFIDTRGDRPNQEEWTDIYVKNNYETKPYFLATCDRYTKQIVSPSCFVRYVINPELIIEYRMHIKYINDWENINNKITALVKSYIINNE